MSDLMIPLLELASKLLIYIGSAFIVGGWFVAILAKDQRGLMIRIRRYILSGAVLALLAIVINFYAQVGSFAESGWAGMVDTSYVTMLWDSPVGYSVILRAIAVSLVLVWVLFTGSLNLLFFSIAGLLLATSFGLLGHTTELPVFIRFLLSLHVMIALLWMGSLFPLWQACQLTDVAAVQALMHRFGVIAGGLVTVLIACGLVIAYQLLGSWSELVETNYGLMLLAKIVLVAVILGFAVWHKWRLVPQLGDEGGVLKLRRSILLEGLVGLGILAVTVLLTTVVGPDSMHS